MSRSFGGTRLTTVPPIAISPSVISSRPAIMRSSVDLPQPEGPTSTQNSPSAIATSTPRMTCVDAEPLLARPLIVTAAMSPRTSRVPVRATRVPRSTDVVGPAGWRTSSRCSAPPCAATPSPPPPKRTPRAASGSRADGRAAASRRGTGSTGSTSSAAPASVPRSSAATQIGQRRRPRRAPC